MVEHQGIGLAAPQIGITQRFFVVDVWWPMSGTTDRALTFVNPVLKRSTDTQRREEGCLSLPGVHERVTRSASVQVEALGIDGKPFSMLVDGLLAVAIQHENDHLDGILALDRMEPLSRRMARKALTR